MNKRVTIKDVAKEAGVSIATISYVLNKKGRVREETEEKVMAAVKKLNYIPDISARSLVSKSSKLLGVVIPQTEVDRQLMLNNPFYSEFLSGVEYYARKHNFQIIVSGTDIDKKYLDMALERNMDGIIVMGMYPDAFYEELKKSNIPIVLVDSYCNDHYFHSVQINDRYGAYLGTKHLIENGHEHIGILTGKIKAGGVVEERYLGYQDALKEYGLKTTKDLVFEGVVDFNYGIESAKEIIKNKKITALFASADILALGVIKGLKGLGSKVPDDISVMGFDDIYISEIFDPGLTTVKQDIYKKGQKAVEIIVKSITQDNNAKQEIVLPVDIMERETVKRLSAKS
ncbi:LacI family DNA-binding transcriptional regulator [Vallitalea pronyensis]|uniref:LacI family DNA-binding transcriptional regulator n=1 Tax=Vallitalea pronyensis TaxID=1348613 RepID=UPI001BAEFF51|nr:LacI family DNA-binding transcriptional regulator [Vallitalea pronyensis]